MSASNPTGGPATSTSRRGWTVAAIVAALAVVMVATWWWASRGGDTPAATPPPATQTTTTTPSPEPTPQTYPTTLFFAGTSGSEIRLFPEERTISTADNPGAVAANAVIDGDSDDPDTIAAWPDGTTVATVNFDGVGDDGVYTVVFTSDAVTERPQEMDRQTARVLVEQLVRSVQIGTTSAGVEFYATTSDDEPAPLAAVLGVDTTKPLRPGNDDDYLAIVYLLTPANGADTAGTFTVTGRAAAFEATVEWQLLQGNAVVKEGFTTATECCTLAPFEFEVSADPGDYTLLVRNTDPSDGEGGPVPQDRRLISVG